MDRQAIIDKYIARYPHLARLAANDQRVFAQNALRLAIPQGVTGSEVLELAKMTQPRRGGWHNPASAENGKKGGRPRNVKYCVCDCDGNLAGHDLDLATAENVLEEMQRQEPDAE